MSGLDLSKLSPKQQELVTNELKTDVSVGLTRDAATQRREEAGGFNVVDPPLKCPGWVCCLLPCIKSIPSMKAFRSIQPEDAEVLRDGKWTRYDASSCVVGDVIRLEEGDIVPADCVLLGTDDDDNDDESSTVLVDFRTLTGETKPRTVSLSNDGDKLTKLYFGGQVLQGSGLLAVVTATGNQTLLAKLIASKKFPPKSSFEVQELGLLSEEDEQGIALVSSSADQEVV